MRGWKWLLQSLLSFTISNCASRQRLLLKMCEMKRMRWKSRFSSSSSLHSVFADNSPWRFFQFFLMTFPKWSTGDLLDCSSTHPLVSALHCLRFDWYVNIIRSRSMIKTRQHFVTDGFYHHSNSWKVSWKSSVKILILELLVWFSLWARSEMQSELIEWAKETLSNSAWSVFPSRFHRIRVIVLLVSSTVTWCKISLYWCLVQVS